MQSLSVAEADRAFLQAVARVAVANPFSEERAEADAALDDGPRPGRPERIAAAAAARLDALVARPPREKPLLARAGPEDKDGLTECVLFTHYHRWASAFDLLIAAQEAEPDEPCAVPFADELLTSLAAYGLARAEARESLALFFQLRRAYTFIDRALTGASPCMQALREALWNDIFTLDVRTYRAHLLGRMEDFSTLLLGETGTGKGSAAAAIGRSGFIPFDERRGRFAESFAHAFVPVNLSEFPESLLEAELFGHEKGAFTGALERREGVFASGSPHGSIFLDEIGELTAPVQIKLLRVLQDRTYTAVGSRKARRFRGRVIAATNRGLDELRGPRSPHGSDGGPGRGGLLREDLYYRLCSDLIVVPPLRQRLAEAPGELEALVRAVLERTLGPGGPELLEPVCATIARDVGPRYGWPGNVRELEQCVRRILLKGRYDGLRAPGAQAADRGLDGDPFLRRAAAGELDADTLLGGYCARLFVELGSYEAVARRTRLDRRTVKRYAELGALEQHAPGPV